MAAAPRDDERGQRTDRWPWNDPRYDLAAAMPAAPAAAPVPDTAPAPAPAAWEPQPAPVATPAVPNRSEEIDPADELVLPHARKTLAGPVAPADDAEARASDFSLARRPRPPSRTLDAVDLAALDHEVPGFDTEFWSDLAMAPVEEGRPPRPVRRAHEQPARRSRFRSGLSRRGYLLCAVAAALGALAGWGRFPALSSSEPRTASVRGAAGAGTTEPTATVHLGDRTLTFRLDSCSSSPTRVSARGIRGEDDTLVAVISGDQLGSILLEVGGTQWAAGHAGQTVLTTDHAEGGVSGSGRFARLDADGTATATQKPGTFTLRC